jgi:hypothetical protein
MAKRNKNAKTAEVSLAKQLIAGIGKHYGNVTSVTFLGKSMTPAEVTTSLQTLVNLRSDAETAKVAATTKIAAENAQAPALRTLMDAFVAVVRATYGTQPDVLADFGLRPTKARTPLTAEQKALAAAKNKATREARHTQGTKQKAGVKGNVTGVVITPVTAATPTPTPAPAASAPVNTGSTSGGTGGGNPSHGS